MSIEKTFVFVEPCTKVSSLSVNVAIPMRAESERELSAVSDLPALRCTLLAFPYLSVFPVIVVAPPTVITMSSKTPIQAPPPVPFAVFPVMVTPLKVMFLL